MSSIAIKRFADPFRYPSPPSPTNRTDGTDKMLRRIGKRPGRRSKPPCRLRYKMPKVSKWNLHRGKHHPKPIRLSDLGRGPPLTSNGGLAARSTGPVRPAAPPPASESTAPLGDPLGERAPERTYHGRRLPPGCNLMEQGYKAPSLSDGCLIACLQTMVADDPRHRKVPMAA
jgi:hypothetical protein